MTYNQLKNLNFRNKTVLLRSDLNVPIKDGKITNDKRIRASLKTIQYLLNKKAKLVICSHLGRPKGESNLKYSLAPVAKRLSKYLGEPVKFVTDCLADKPDCKIVLLENLRFYSEEKKNDSKFAKKLVKGIDFYVNDAFGTCHRAHASVSAVTRYVPSAAGYLLDSELKNLNINNPRKPFIVVLGGSKVSDKIGVIKNLIKKADAILIGGAMIFTFYKALGKETGKSLVENDKLDLAMKLLKASNGKIILPVDVICAEKIDNSANAVNYHVDAIPKKLIGLDIGPKSIMVFSEILKRSKTVVWNGPMGVFEIPKFSKGTKSIAKILADGNMKSIIGGGDSAAAVEKYKLQDKMNHVSTGGGASLEYLEGKILPAIKALEKSYEKFK